MRAAIYARVSSAAQRDRHTIENQLRVLPAFVQSQGWDLVGTYVDDGRSAKAGKLDERDGFARLVRDAEKRRFDLLVVVDIDRLTRTDSLEERAQILGPFQRLGIDIVTPSGGRLDMRTMLGELWVTIQALGAAEENRKRAERIKAGKVRAIAEGRKPAGPTPFGLAYDRVTGAWSVDEEAATIVREIYERVAAGESCVSVADDLERRGVRGPKKGWSRAAVYRTMHTRYTCGEWLVDKVRGVTMTVPRILSDDLWFAAQKALKKARRRGLNRTQHVYLLQGLARCVCGGKILIRSGVKYYNAQHEPREHPAAYFCAERREKKCDEPIAYCRDLDERVWSKLMEELAHPDLLDEIELVQNRRASDAHDWAADIEGFKAHLARLDKVEAEFMTMYRRGQISKSAWEIEIPKLTRERKMVNDQLRAATNALGSTMSSKERLLAVSASVARLRAALPKATLEQRRALLRELAHEDGVLIVGGRAELVLDLVVRADEPQVREPTLRVVDRSVCRTLHDTAVRIRLVA
jgi:site-specific DNA recombinase